MMTLERLTTRTLWRDYAFDRVTIDGRPDGESASRPLASILPVCWGEYPSGPGLIGLADVAGAVFGPGFYGLHSCRPLGWRPAPADSLPVVSLGQGEYARDILPADLLA